MRLVSKLLTGIMGLVAIATAGLSKDTGTMALVFALVFVGYSIQDREVD